MPKLFTMKIKILCTLGPASLRGDVIRGLEERGVDLFRINLSHTPPEAVEPTIALIRRYSNIPICLDTQGAQVRCGMMAEGVTLERPAPRQALAEDVVGTAEQHDPLAGVGVRRRCGPATPSTSTSTAPSSRSMDVQRPRPAPGRRARRRPGEVQPGGDHGPAARPRPDHRQGRDGHRDRRPPPGSATTPSRSPRAPADVELIRALIPEGSTVISKIESRAGVRNRDEIIDASDAVLIDRGDLSREVPVEYVPYYQKAIVRQANRWNTPVYVATNLLESMVTSARRPSPR